MEGMVWCTEKKTIGVLIASENNKQGMGDKIRHFKEVKQNEI